MNRYTFAVLSLAAGLLAASCGALNAGAPLKINFQGRLSESGQPAEGTKTFVFKLYDAASGGTLVWTSQSQSIALSQGMFSAALAAGTPAAISTASFAGARYVEMTVDGVTLSPRQEMTSAPYALVAQALAADADIPPTAIAPGSVRDSHVALSTGAVSSGRFADDRVSITTGAFASLNGADQLVKLDGAGKLPAVDGSALTNIGATQVPSLDASKITTGKFYDARLAVSTGAFPGGFNGASQLLQLDGSGLVPDADIPGLAASKITAGVFNDNRLAVSTGAFPGGFNGASQLLQLDGSGLIPDADIPGLAASKVTSGVFNDNRLAVSTGAFPGGFNGANQLLQLDGTSKLPAVDGSALTNIGAAQIPSLDASKIGSGVFNDNRLAVSTGAFPGGFNGPGQLVKLDGNARLGIGTASPNSPLSVDGAIALKVRTISYANTPYTPTAVDSTILVDGTTGATGDTVVTLPEASSIIGRIYVVKRVDIRPGLGYDYNVNIKPYGLQTIEGAVGYALNSVQWQSVTIQSAGAYWIVLATN